MLRFGTDYVDRGQEYYERRYHNRVVSNLMRRAQKFGYTLTKSESPPTIS
jgi:transposase